MVGAVRHGLTGLDETSSRRFSDLDEEFDVLLGRFDRPAVAAEIVGEPMVSLDRDRIALEWTGQGRMSGALDPPGFAPTGTLVNMRGVDIHTFRGDLVAHVVTITDVAAVALQIGAMPPAGSIGEKMGVQVQHLMARRLRRKS